MKRNSFWSTRFARIMIPGGSLLLLGDCGLSDQQLTSVAQSVLTTGLTTFVTQAISALFSVGAGTM